MRQVSEIDIKNLEIIREGVTKAIKAAAEQYDKEELVLLDVAPQDWAGAKEFFKLSKIDTLDIDPSAKATYTADLTQDNSDVIPNSKYDMIILTEVLEHTLNPFDAVKELYRILKPGGRVIMTTPFNFRIHGPLPDCWRFSEHGLKALLKDFSDIQITENGTERFLFPVQYITIAQK